MTTKTIGKMTMLALALGGSAVLSSCEPHAGSNPAAIENRGDVGGATFALQLASGVTINSATYVITGPGGFSTSAPIDVSHSSTLTAVVGNLPQGTGYLVTISATTADGATTCGGSAHFDVTARMTTSVSVPLDCHEPARTGSASITGVLNTCPVVDGVSANPAEVTVGSSIALAGAAHDSDNGPSPLTYAWTTTSGTLSSASGASPTLTCTTPGAATVTLTVSDGDATSGCADTLTAQVTCTGVVSGVVSSALFTPGSATDPTVSGGHFAGAKVCADANDNGKCEAGEQQTTTDASGHFSLNVTSSASIIADIGVGATNTANGSATTTRNVFRTATAQLAEQAGAVVISPASTEVVRQIEANGTDYATEKGNLATRLGVTTAQVLADATTLSGAAQTAVLREEVVLQNRFAYAITKLDRGDKFPDALANPGGNPELTGLAGVTPATATTPETRSPITFKQAEQAAFNVEGIPRYDHIFIVMLENKSTQAILGSRFAPKINAYLHAGNWANSYFATGNPSEPNYTALGGGDDFGIVDDSQWNCDATGANAPQDTLPSNDQPGLASSPFAKTCTQGLANHNIVGRPNLFNAITAAGMSWRTYSESMNPGQDFRTDSVADPAVFALDNVYAPGTIGGNASTVGTANLQLPLPANLYRTKHHPGMAYQNVRSAPEFKYSNRTLGGGQWDGVLLSSTKYAVPAGYDLDQMGTDLGNGGVGQLNFVIPDQCDDMHGITVNGKVNGTGSTITASDCSSIGNNQPVATGGNIITRGDNYVDYVVKKIQASPVWTNTQKKTAIVLMFDEGNSTTNLNSCCGWKAGKTAADAPLAQSGSSWAQDTSIAQYGSGNKGHGKSIFVVLNNQPTAPHGIVDDDAYSHFSFVRTLQDMFGLADPASDASYMNRSKYTEKFIAQNILNLPEFAGSADTHYDSVRPMNHAYVIPAGYTEKATDDDTQPLQVGPDATQTNIFSIK
ncbi:MAG TPA: PKD domain-containing protein [Polyangia bacterium]|nr:PKD domain-containing protein [Polyangia bacterium]